MIIIWGITSLSNTVETGQLEQEIWDETVQFYKAYFLKKLGQKHS